MLSRLHQCQISYNKETWQMRKDFWVITSYHKLNTATSSWVVQFFQSNSFLTSTLLYFYNIKRLREFNEMSKLRSLSIQGLTTTLCKICHIAPAPLMYDLNYLKTAFTIAHYLQTHVKSWTKVDFNIESLVNNLFTLLSQSRTLGEHRF